MSLTTGGRSVVWGPAGSSGNDAALALWGIGTARTFRVHWMMAELELPYVSHRIQSRTGETMTPEYLRLNPRHKIPMLQHGSLLMTESAAIIQYLSERFDTPATFFAPVDPERRARVFEWCCFILNELDGHTLYVIRRHVGLKHIYGEAPTAVESAKIYFREQIEALEPRFVAAGGACLFGERLSVADILLTTCLDWAISAEIALPEPVLVYRERLRSRAAYREAARRNDASIEPPLHAFLPTTQTRTN